MKNTIEISPVFTIEQGEFYSSEYNDFENSIHSVTVKIHNDETQESIGYAEMKIMNRAIIRHSNATEIMAADAYSDKVYEYSVRLFNAYGGIKENIAEQLGIWFSEELYDIAFVMRIVIYPKFRGYGILRDLFQFMRFQMGQTILYVGEPFPLQYEGRKDREEKDGLNNFSKELKKFKNAKNKIRRHYINNGLISIPSAKGLLFLFSANEPNQILDNPEM